MLVRTVTLELLRHGPWQNQLLSSLTQYLALCGNHPAESVSLDFDHRHFQRRLRALRYGLGNTATLPARLEVGDDIARLLSQIRALPVELASAVDGPRSLVHLRLVLSAAELAMLPFELARSPLGFPGAGQPLALQASGPLVITREVRRVPRTTVKWHDRPRILFIAAAPEGVPDIPLQGHLLALRQAVDPWLVAADSGPSVTDASIAEFKREFQDLITILPRATIGQIQKACAAQHYTHVHILAHGLPADDEGDGVTQYRLALHGEPGGVDLVDGTRLAAALRCHPAEGEVDLSRAPTVVTLASCDSGNVGSVMAPDPSVAWELHRAGIPLVIASQFPLSKAGSVILTEIVYRRLLRGDDPRIMLREARQTLYAQRPDSHDWAAMVTYAALPADLDSQLREARLAAARRAVDVAMARFDRRDRPADSLEQGLLEAMRWLKAAVPDDGRGVRIRANGVLASAYKRLAQLRSGGNRPLFPLLPPGDPNFDAQRRARAAAEESRRDYLAVFRISASEAWAAVQYLALTVAVGAIRERGDRVQFDALWITAKEIAELEKRSADEQRRAWASGSLLELWVIRMAQPEYLERDEAPAAAQPEESLLRPTPPNREHEVREQALRELQVLLESADESLYRGATFDLYSTFKQIDRFANWWFPAGSPTQKLAAELCQRLLAHGVPTKYDRPE